MNSFLKPHNATPLTGFIDIAAHSISLFQENERPQNIKDTFIPKSDISAAEPYGVQIGGELGDNIVTMYQFIGDINDTKVGGLKPLLNYMNENFFGKDEPAANEHHFHITRKQHNQDFSTHHIYTVDINRSYKTNNRNFNANNFYNSKQFVTHNLTNYITKRNSITNTEHVSDIKKTCSTKHYITNVFRSNNDYIGNSSNKKYDNRTFKKTGNISNTHLIITVMASLIIIRYTK